MARRSAYEVLPYVACVMLLAAASACSPANSLITPSHAVSVAIAPSYVQADLPTIASDAALIVRGTIVDQRAEIVREPNANQRYVITVSTVSVIGSYKGNAAGTLEIVVPGGVAGGVITASEGEADLVIGQTYVLFLGMERDRLVVWGGAQGAAALGSAGELVTRYPVAWKPTTLADLEKRLDAMGVR
jgi:hypothetical protein